MTDTTFDAKDLQQERWQIKKDIYDNKIPQRVFNNVTLNFDVVSAYGNIDNANALWNADLLEKALDELSEMLPTDLNPHRGTFDIPAVFQALGSRNKVLSSTGFMQHPNVQGLLAEEYDEFIEDPYACMIERVLPRNYAGFEYFRDPVSAMFALYRVALADERFNGRPNPQISQRLQEKYGYFPGYIEHPFESGGSYAPLDILTDNLRSFSEILNDIKRRPKKVLDAVEAVYPLNLKKATPAVITGYSYSGYALHMAPYMSTREFEKFYWPAWKRQCTDLASMGVRTMAFCEHDFMRYLDHLQELPAQAQLTFEFGDAKTIKEKLGSRHILSGLFPLANLKSCTKEEIVYKTREFLDLMMPGGNFQFQFDKDLLVLSDINMENLKAVLETVRDYGVYDNAGQSAGDAFCKEDYTYSGAPAFKSKYYTSWEEYKAQHPFTPENAKSAVEEMEDAILQRVYSLCQ